MLLVKKNLVNEVEWPHMKIDYGIVFAREDAKRGRAAVQRREDEFVQWGGDCAYTLMFARIVFVTALSHFPGALS